MEEFIAFLNNNEIALLFLLLHPILMGLIMAILEEIEEFLRKG